jgi:hypothetical protein
MAGITSPTTALILRTNRRLISTHHQGNKNDVNIFWPLLNIIIQHVLSVIYIATQVLQIIHANVITEQLMINVQRAITILLTGLRYETPKTMLTAVLSTTSPVVLRPWVQVRQVKPSFLTS